MSGFAKESIQAFCDQKDLAAAAIAGVLLASALEQLGQTPENQS
jgi:hypothetical protein